MTRNTRIDETLTIPLVTAGGYVACTIADYDDALAHEMLANTIAALSALYGPLTVEQDLDAHSELQAGIDAARGFCLVGR